MVSTLNLEEKYNRVRKNFCFYLDIQDHELARSISRRLQDMTLQQEVFLTSRVTHVVSDAAAAAARAPAQRQRCSAPRTRADAMLERVRGDHRPRPNLVHLTVQKAICLLDKLYDTFYTAPRKPAVRFFTKEYIKIEFLDKNCRPVFKEFDDWPEISVDPDPPRETKKESPVEDQIPNDINQNHQTAGQKMTRKSRPRIKEKEEKEPKGGYCEMCNADYADVALHRRAPPHLAFVRDHANYLQLDQLITSTGDVAAFLDRASQPVNGERRSSRKVCNGDAEPKRRSKRSQSPDSTVNGNESPKPNGLDEDKKNKTRCSKKLTDEERQYYKVVGVSTKLRSSGGFLAKRKESPPTCNGSKPLVVKFRKVRRSELSVLSDEAEQFMFPKRASSTSSTSSDEDDKPEELSPRRKTVTPQPPPLSIERRRLARPVALKEESSEEDGWPDDKRRRKRRAGPPVKRGRRVPLKPRESLPPPEPETPVPPEEPEPPPAEDISPLREEAPEKCMKWEGGRLRYTPAVEQLEFAFESVPQSEPWFETFKRQDQDKVAARNIHQYFALYSAKSPKLPYEIGLLPPLKPNCCPLSDLIKRDEKAGPSRSYGTRGMKKQKIRKRTAAATLIALEAHPRKSPREHASTLAILGSAGLLNKRRHPDDAKSTASEDTSDTHSTVKVEPAVSEAQEESDRLKQFLSEVFEDAGDFEVSEEAMDGEAAVVTSTNLDMTSLVSECEDCDIIRNEIKESVEARGKARRGKFKKKNKTGWPNKKKSKKGSRTSSLESQKPESLDRSSAEPPDDETTQDTISEEGEANSEAEVDKTEVKSDGDEERTLVEEKDDQVEEKHDQVEEKDDQVEEKDDQKDDQVEKMEVTETLTNKRKRNSRSSTSEEEKEDRRRKRRALAGLLLQPVVRVARVDPNAARRLRSAAKPRARATRLR